MSHPGNDTNNAGATGMRAGDVNHAPKPSLKPCTGLFEALKTVNGSAITLWRITHMPKWVEVYELPAPACLACFWPPVFAPICYTLKRPYQLIESDTLCALRC